MSSNCFHCPANNQKPQNRDRWGVVASWKNNLYFLPINLNIIISSVDVFANAFLSVCTVCVAYPPRLGLKQTECEHLKIPQRPGDNICTVPLHSAGWALLLLLFALYLYSLCVWCTAQPWALTDRDGALLKDAPGQVKHASAFPPSSLWTYKPRLFWFLFSFIPSSPLPFISLFIYSLLLPSTSLPLLLLFPLPPALPFIY